MVKKVLKMIYVIIFTLEIHFLYSFSYFSDLWTAHHISREYRVKTVNARTFFKILYNGCGTVG
jgi:hypothetical protein